MFINKINFEKNCAKKVIEKKPLKKTIEKKPVFFHEKNREVGKKKRSLNVWNEKTIEKSVLNFFRDFADIILF